MEKQFVPYEEAMQLKELGFDELCLVRWDGGGLKMLQAYDPLKNSEIKEPWFCVLPLWQQAFDWFTKKGLHSYIDGAHPWFRYYINTEDDRYEGFKHLHIEEARLECLKKLIELCKEK